MALWLPSLPTDRVRLRQTSTSSGQQGHSPLVLTEKIGGALRLAAVDRMAADAGLAVGMMLADARARLSALDVQDMDRAADAKLLQFLVRASMRYSPSVAIYGEDGLSLDITGCTHLFGGEAAMLNEVQSFVQTRHLQVRGAIAGTIEAAHAIARFGSGGVSDEGSDGAHVAPLPVAALELDASTRDTLNHLGLKTIGDLATRPRAPLAARFGPALLERLERTLGVTDIPPVSLRPLPPCWAEQRFPEPIARMEDVETALKDLLSAIMADLERRGEGGRQFECLVFRTDGIVRSVRTSAGQPVRDVQIIARLFQERFESLQDPLDPGFGFDLIRLVADETEPLSAAQIDMDGQEDARRQASAAFVDRLTARLGRRHVLRLASRETHIPEHASYVQPFTGRERLLPQWPTPHPGAIPLRPLTLFDPPQPIEAVIYEAPDKPPRQFRWRRRLHETVKLEGPERIEAEWWRQHVDVVLANVDSSMLPSQARMAAEDEGGAFAHHGSLMPDLPSARDYYRMETTGGHRLWIYQPVATNRWFVHGLFP